MMMMNMMMVMTISILMILMTCDGGHVFFYDDDDDDNNEKHDFVPENVINKYQVGAITPSCTPLAIAETINTLLDNNELRNQYKINTIEASNQLSWENEVIEIVKVYKSLQIN